MGTHVAPDLTSPVTRGQLASIGVMANIGTAQASSTSGGITAAGSSIGGGINNSLGGTAFQAEQSSNQIPTSRGGAGAQPTVAVVSNRTNGVAGAGGGGSKALTTSSTNVLAIQSDSKAYQVTEYAALQTAATSVGSSVMGQDTVAPKSLAVELPANTVKVHVLPSATIAAATQISYKGEYASNFIGMVKSGTQAFLVGTAQANAPVGGPIGTYSASDWQNGGNTFGPNGLPTSSSQPRTQNLEFQPNSVIPFEDKTADKP